MFDFLMLAAATLGGVALAHSAFVICYGYRPERARIAAVSVFLISSITIAWVTG